MLLAASVCQQAATMSAYKFTPRAVASPDAPQKPLVRKRARCLCVWSGAIPFVKEDLFDSRGPQWLTNMAELRLTDNVAGNQRHPLVGH